MGFIKRAGLYCFRQRLKTMILFLVLTLIAVCMLTAIAIRDAANETTADMRTAIGGKIILEIDTEGHMGSAQEYEWGTASVYNGDQITQEIVDAIQKVDGVTGYNVEEAAGYYGAGVNFKYLPTPYGLSYTPYGESSSYTVTLSSEKCKAFLSGKYNLVDGRHITPDDEYACLISKELADYNQLAVGDKAQMYSLDSDSVAEFTIVGIFDGTKGASKEAYTASDIPGNLGYIDYASLRDIFKDMFDEDFYQYLTIFVEDPAGVKNVYDKISALPELQGKTLKLTIDTDEYDDVSSPLESLRQLVRTAIVIVSVVSVLILTLLLTIWIRGRKKEIGILLSIGTGKANVLLQMFTETFAVAMLSFAAAIPFGNLTAKKAGAYLASQAAEGAASLHVQMDAVYLVHFYLIGILLITVSVVASAWTVLCLKPKDILTKMS